MRYSIAVSALLAAAAVASPIDNKKRDVVVQTVYDVVYEYVYVTAGGGSVTTTSVSQATASATVAAFRGQPLRSHRQPSHSTTPTSTTPTSTVQPVKTVSTSAVATSAAPATSTHSVVTVQTSSSVVKQTSSAAAPSSTSVSGYQNTVLLHHNVHRANHSAPNIAWSDDLAAIANEWASYCIYEHNTTIGGGGYGQNIAAGAAPSAISNVITDMMYNGEMPYYAPYYGDANPDFTNFDEFGHFTQIVWKGTTSVGCATVDCTGGLQNVGSGVSPYMTVCNYGPPGNMGGEYGDNVGSPLGQPTVTGNYGLN